MICGAPALEAGRYVPPSTLHNGGHSGSSSKPTSPDKAAQMLPLLPEMTFSGQVMQKVSSHAPPPDIVDCGEDSARRDRADSCKPAPLPELEQNAHFTPLPNFEDNFTAPAAPLFGGMRGAPGIVPVGSLVAAGGMPLRPPIWAQSAQAWSFPPTSSFGGQPRPQGSGSVAPFAAPEVSPIGTFCSNVAASAGQGCSIHSRPLDLQPPMQHGYPPRGAPMLAHPGHPVGVGIGPCHLQMPLGSMGMQPGWAPKVVQPSPCGHAPHVVPTPQSVGANLPAQPRY